MFLMWQSICMSLYIYMYTEYHVYTSEDMGDYLDLLIPNCKCRAAVGTSLLLGMCRCLMLRYLNACDALGI